MRPVARVLLVCSVVFGAACSSSAGESEGLAPAETAADPSPSVASTSTSSSTSTTSTTLAPEGIVYSSIRLGDLNTSAFQVSMQTFPEFAQSFVLSQPLDVSEVQLAVSHAMIVQPSYFTTPLVDQWKHYTIEPAFGPLTFDVTTTFYEATTGELVVDLLDVTEGFDMVSSRSTRVTMEKTIGYGQGWTGEPNVRIDLGDSVRLEPGKYVVVMSFAWTDQSVFLLRLFGRQAGDNTRSGYDQDQPGDCEYTPAVDSNEQGRAYTGLGTTKWDGSAAGSIGYGTTFRPAMAKVTDCVEIGQYQDIWNQGDVYLTLYGRPA